MLLALGADLGSLSTDSSQFPGLTEFRDAIHELPRAEFQPFRVVLEKVQQPRAKNLGIIHRLSQFCHQFAPLVTACRNVSAKIQIEDRVKLVDSDYPLSLRKLPHSFISFCYEARYFGTAFRLNNAVLYFQITRLQNFPTRSEHHPNQFY